MCFPVDLLPYMALGNTSQTSIGIWPSEKLVFCFALESGYAGTELVHMTCCPTLLEGNSVCSCSKWPHWRAELKDSRHRERGDGISFKYGIKGAHFQTFSSGRHSSCYTLLFAWKVVSRIKKESSTEKFKPWLLFHLCKAIQAVSEVGVNVVSLVSESSRNCQTQPQFWRQKVVGGGAYFVLVGQTQCFYS